MVVIKHDFCKNEIEIFLQCGLDGQISLDRIKRRGVAQEKESERIFFVRPSFEMAG
jgi:hypothetical protein